MKVRARSNDEDRIMQLVEQSPLSTSEIIRCFERNITDVSSADKIIAGVYEDSVQATLANEEFMSGHSNAVLEAVSNLYLKREVILEIA